MNLLVRVSAERDSLRVTAREVCEAKEHARRRHTAVSEVQLRRAAEMFLAASDRGRLRILLVLARGPAFVSAIAREVGLRVPRVSQQLMVLRLAHLVAPRRRGTRVEYSLVDHHVEALVAIALAANTRG